jgi:ribosomal protein L11
VRFGFAKAIPYFIQNTTVKSAIPVLFGVMEYRSFSFSISFPPRPLLSKKAFYRSVCKSNNLSAEKQTFSKKNED